MGKRMQQVKVGCVVALVVLACAVAHAQDVAPPPQTTQVVFPAPATDITALIVLFATALGGSIAKGFWDGYQRRKDKEDAKKDAESAAQAKAEKNAALDAKLDQAVTTATTNLRLNAHQLRRLADATRDPEDIAAADMAEKVLRAEKPNA